MDDPERAVRAAYVFSQSVAGLIEAMGMVAENKQREVEGFPPTYTQKEFLALLDAYGLHHNSVTKMLWH